MRKITKEAVSAFEARENFKKANMEVVARMGHADMLLHGNLIAQTSEKGLMVSLAGWNSNTTRERLNGLKGVRVSTKLGQAYLNGKPWEGEMVLISAWDAIKTC